MEGMEAACDWDNGGGMMCYRNGYFQVDASIARVVSCGYPGLPSRFDRVC